MWIGGFGQGKRFYTRISRMMITKEGEGPWRDSSWREILRGETLSVDRLLRGEASPWREALCGEILQGETLSIERTAEERKASWRDSLHGETSPRRNNLQVENISVERLFEERRALGRTRPALTYKLLRLVHICQLQYSFSWYTSSSSFLKYLCNLASPSLCIVLHLSRL
jgi:hypothetical protein